VPQEEFVLRALSPDDNVSGLSLGEAAFTPLKTFLKKHSKRYHACNAAKTYVFANKAKPPKVFAYVTLICS
jgi:hypothetical protein